MALIKAKKAEGDADRNAAARVYTTLDELMRLQHRARGFSFLPRQPVHSILAGRHGSRLRGRGLNFEELRHYCDGDDTRTIDWLATARANSPYVRVYTGERDRNVLLLVDQRLSMFFGSRLAMKSVVAADIAALAAWHVCSLGDRIGALVFGDTEIIQFRPEARGPAVLRILHEVARQNRALGAAAFNSADTGAGMLNEALRRAVRLATHDWLVCLIGDASGSDAETRQLVTRLTAHNDVIAILIYDPLEAALPDIGHAVVAQGGRQIEVNTSSSALRRRFAGAFTDLRARIEFLSRARAIPVLPIVTNRDPAAQLREILGRRMAPGGIRPAVGVLPTRVPR